MMSHRALSSGSSPFFIASRRGDSAMSAQNWAIRLQKYKVGGVNNIKYEYFIIPSTGRGSKKGKVQST